MNGGMCEGEGERGGHGEECEGKRMKVSWEV